MAGQGPITSICAAARSIQGITGDFRHRGQDDPRCAARREYHPGEQSRPSRRIVSEGLVNLGNPSQQLNERGRCAGDEVTRTLRKGGDVKIGHIQIGDLFHTIQRSKPPLLPRNQGGQAQHPVTI